MKKIGYARVSTDEQNMDLQMDALKAADCDLIFQDQGINGATVKRQGLSQALEVVREDDLLVVWKLDRLGRSLSFLIELIDNLKEDGADFQSLTDGIDTTTTGGKLVFHIMGALVEFERSLTVERTRAGIRAARRRGKHVGRPHSLTTEQIDHAKQMVDGGKHTVSGMADILGVDRKTVSRAINR